MSAKAERTYSGWDCATWIECPGEWINLEKWADSLNLSGDDAEYIGPEIDSAGVVRVSVPMWDSLIAHGMEVPEQYRRTCPECGSKNAYEHPTHGDLVCWCGEEEA